MSVSTSSFNLQAGPSEWWTCSGIVSSIIKEEFSEETDRLKAGNFTRLSQNNAKTASYQMENFSATNPARVDGFGGVDFLPDFTLATLKRKKKQSYYNHCLRILFLLSEVTTIPPTFFFFFCGSQMRVCHVPCPFPFSVSAFLPDIWSESCELDTLASLPQSSYCCRGQNDKRDSKTSSQLIEPKISLSGCNQVKATPCTIQNHTESAEQRVHIWLTDVTIKTNHTWIISVLR